MPLILDEANRKRMASRLMIQPPKSQHDIAEFQRFSREIEKAAGLPADVLITLESLLLLAEQGNLVAQWLYGRECARHGITFAKRFV